MENIGIEEYLLSNLNAYIGKTDRHLKEHFDIDKTTNKSSWVELTYRMLGVSSNKAQELIDSNIIVKTIRINKNGKIKENMSFPTIKFKKLILENWEESYIHEYFSSKTFLFIIYKETGVDYVFLGGTFWKMPVADLNGIVSEEWEEICSIVSRGISFTVKDGKVTNNLPKKSKTRVIHLRPKASKAAYSLNNGFSIGNTKKDGDQLPNGEWMTSQCFWLNNDYILDQIENKSIFVKYTNSVLSLDDYKCSLLIQSLTKEFYTIEDLKTIFRNTLQSNDYKYINAHNLKKLGYMFNYNYIYSSKFDSIKQYIGSLLMHDEIVDLNIIEPNLREINNYDELIDQIVRDYPVYRIRNGIFVKSTKLNRGGISEKSIHDFIGVAKRTYQGSYFSIQSLRKLVELNEMFNHGFEDCFYEDIVLSANEYEYFSINGTRVFCNTAKKNTFSGLLEDTLNQTNKMDIYDLKGCLYTLYGIKIDVKMLKSALRFSDLYYNQDTYKVYINHHVFIEEIKLG